MKSASPTTSSKYQLHELNLDPDGAWKYVGGFQHGNFRYRSGLAICRDGNEYRIYSYVTKRHYRELDALGAQAVLYYLAGNHGETNDCK